jgi:hypothetical protein
MHRLCLKESRTIDCRVSTLFRNNVYLTRYCYRACAVTVLQEKTKESCRLFVDEVLAEVNYNNITLCWVRLQVLIDIWNPLVELPCSFVAQSFL